MRLCSHSVIADQMQTRKLTSQISNDKSSAPTMAALNSTQCVGVASGFGAL
jgi:hypothetical protein